MQKTISIYAVLLCFIITTCNPLYAQICEPCGVTFLENVTEGEITNPVSVAYSPDGRCLAVVNYPLNNVSVFRVDPQTCALTAVGVFATNGLNPIAAAYSPNSRCLVVTNAGIQNDPGNPGSISVFTVDLETCALELVTELPIVIGGTINPTLLAFSPILSPNGSYCLAIVNQGSNDISVFTVDPDMCTLDFVNTYDTGPTPLGVQYSPDGTCLVVSNLNVGGGGVGTLSIFEVNQTTCALAEIVNSPIASGGQLPTSVTYLRDGQCLAVTNSNLIGSGPADQENIALFSVNQTTCELNLVNTILIDVGSAPFVGAYSSSASCFSVANIFSNTITNYAVSPMCQLTQIGDPITVGAFPRSLTYSPNGKCLVVANSGFNPLGTPGTEMGSISLFSTNFVTTPTLTIATNCSEVTLTGTADLNTTVTLFQNDIAVAIVPVDALGNFMFNLTLPAGTYSFTAQATSALGCTSALSLPVITSVNVITIRQVFSTCLSPASVYGTSAQPGATVRLLVDGIPVVTSIADSEGNFFITNISLPAGNHCFVAQDLSSGCVSLPVCADIKIISSCYLNAPNLSFGTHCSR